MPIQTSINEVSGIQKQVKYGITTSLLAFVLGIHLSTMRVDGVLKMNVWDCLADWCCVKLWKKRLKEVICALRNCEMSSSVSIVMWHDPWHQNEGARCPISNAVVLRGVERQWHYLMTLWAKTRCNGVVWRMWRCFVYNVCRYLYYKC